MARRIRVCGLLAFVAAYWGAPLVVPGGEPSRPLLQRFSGRVPILGLNPQVYPNPVTLTPENENCTNMIDDDGDTFTDFTDPDCLAELGPQDLNLKLPFDVVQPIAGFLPARYVSLTSGHPRAPRA